MEKKLSDQKDTPDNQENINDLDRTLIKESPALTDDSLFLSEDEDVKNDEEDELNFHNFENAEFVEELNQQNESIPEGDPFEIQDNPYLDDMNFEDPELDIPGSDLDDEMESIGSEDEENNYYSLGGDNHEDLEEQHFDEEL